MPENSLRTTRRDGLLLVCLFLAATALHGIVGGFAKQLTIYRDEWLYASMADSLQAGRGISVQGMDVAFQKVGYPLLLAPFFAVHDPILRVQLIGWLNSLLIMSSVFPVWLIGRELGLRKGYRWLAVAMASLLPETLMTATFMAENLYWPLVFWCVWIWLLNERLGRWRLSVLGGVAGCFAYLVKEAFLAVAAAFIILDLARLVRDWKKNRHMNRGQLLRLLIYVATFFGLIAVFQWGILASVGYSYSGQIASSMLTDWPRVGYLAMTILYYIAATTCAALVLPISMTLALRREMDVQSKRFTDLVWLYLGITIIFIAYTVCLPYDFGNEIPRFHLRYYAPGVILLLMALMLGIQQASSESISKRNLLKTALFSFGAIGLIAFCYRGNRYGSVVDQFSLSWYDEIYWNFERQGQKEVGTPLFIGIIAVVTILLVLLLWRKKTRIALVMYACMMLAVFTWDWVALVPRLEREYRTDTALVSEVLAVNDVLAEASPNETLLVLADHETDPAVRHCIDTFLEVPCRVEAPLYVDQARNWEGGHVTTASEEVEWLLIGGQNLTVKYIFPDGERINLGEESQLQLYRCNGSKQITLAIDDASNLTDAATRETPLKIRFYGEQANAGHFVTGGLYAPEDGFCWSQGHEITFEIQASRVFETVMVELEVGGSFNFYQPFEVWCGGEMVYSSEVIEPDTFLFDLHPQDAVLSFSIRLPEAVEVNKVLPESGDGRCVAIQMRRMALWVENE